MEAQGFNCRFCESQNLAEKSNKKSLQKFLLLLAFAKSRVPLNFIDSNLPNKVDFAESALDSADLQGGWLLRNARKSFGLPREQSSLAMTDFDGLPRRFCESARNDKFILDSADLIK